MTPYSRDFQQEYFKVLDWVHNLGVVELNERTGVRVKVGHGGAFFKFGLENGLLPVPGRRKVFPKSVAAEVAWFLRGDKEVEFVRKYAPLWDKFVEDEAGKEVVKSAYGYRWRKHFGRDQIRSAIDALKKNPSDRRVYISSWDPGQDGLGAEGQMNVPCPAAFTLNIIDGQLHSALFIRSSDVFVGLPYDVMGHAILMEALAKELGTTLGTMTVALSHVHLYECHWEMAEEFIYRRPDIKTELPLPGWSVSQIENEPDQFVQEYTAKAKDVDWPTWNPKPEVVL